MICLSFYYGFMVFPFLFIDSCRLLFMIMIIIITIFISYFPSKEQAGKILCSSRDVYGLHYFFLSTVYTHTHIIINI